MQAVILAAGVSSRLAPKTNGGPKCLVRVGERTLLEHQITTLRECGVGEIIIVTGYCDSRIKREAPPGCRFVHNPHYATTNSLFSFSCVYDLIRGPFMLLNGDVFAHPEVYQRVAFAVGTVLSVDSTSGQDEEHMKVQIQDGLVRAISKSLPNEFVHGENVGIIKFCREGAFAMISAAREITSEDAGRNMWAPAGIDKIASKMPVGVVDVADLPWVEIDFPADLDHARKVTYPSIYGVKSRLLG